MKALKTLLIGMLAFTATAASAQVFEAQDGTKYEFQKHWFFDLEGGVQYTLGEAKLRRLIRPNVQVAIGRQFNPVIGLRLQVNGWQSRGYWDLGLLDKQGNIFPGHYPVGYTYKYVAPGLDLMFDITNLIGGYNPTRIFGLKAFVGGGANIGFDNDELNDHLNKDRGNGLTLRNNPAPNTTGHGFEYVWDGSQVLPFGRAGLEASFRLNKCISLLIEGNANILSDKYNSKKTDNADWYFNALAGLRFNLGNTYTKTLPPPPAPEPVPVVEKSNEPDPAILELQRQLNELKAKETVEPLRRDIFFLINKTDIRESEAQKVKEIAHYLIKYPKAKVVVTGYADAGTGNDKINDRLAAGRADAVVKSLQEQYGIESSRITYDSKGSRVQPFSDNDMNRVSICIAE
jgi:outer membrane protein OmpA-like peptidoglycan-associated protein